MFFWIVRPSRVTGPVDVNEIGRLAPVTSNAADQKKGHTPKKDLFLHPPLGRLNIRHMSQVTKDLDGDKY